jgi:cyclohexanecarboxylate-CoA ligase
LTAATIAEALRRNAAIRPAKTALVDARMRLTYRALDELVDRVAAGLREHGVRPGDTVSCILPNRAEAVALFFATARLGAVLAPIVPIYGAREVRFILRQTASVLAVVPGRFRGVDYRALLERVRPDAPSLRAVVVVEDGFPASLTGGAGRRRDSADPPAIAAVLYTSGTTAEPKGVLHSHHTLLTEARATADYHRLGDDEVFVMASPVSHISGLLYGMLLPIALGATSVLMETWEPERFLDLVEHERGTFSAGATPFLRGVVDSPTLAQRDLRCLRVFPCGGADVPPALIRRAIDRLGIRTGRGYGSTEFPSITSSAGPGVPLVKRAETDGTPIGPNEIELRDESGRAVTPGTAGEIWARGPELFPGYRDPALDAEAFDARGFFRTGDLGVVDADGYLAITGRVKDIIVRGGEKLSAKEIEDLLGEHPQVASVAVVPVADDRLGERVCAVVVPVDRSAPPSLDALVGFLAERELSRRKLPERLEIVDELPTTASGKVQKHLLRAALERARRPE